LTNSELLKCLDEIQRASDVLNRPSEEESKVTLEELVSLQEIVSVLFEKVNSIEIPQQGITHEGAYLHKFFEPLGVSFSSAPLLVKIIEGTINLLSKGFIYIY